MVLQGDAAVASTQPPGYAVGVNIVDELHAIATALRGAGVRYAVCGGIAVSAHGAPRTTKDIDIVVSPADLTSALAAVAPLGYSLLAAPMVFGAGTPKERHVQRVTKIERGLHLTLDLLIAEAAYVGALDDVVDVEVAGNVITFVSRETLLRMKRMAGRPIDQIDIEKLEEHDHEA
jgi:hypothetical protein